MQVVRKKIKEFQARCQKKPTLQVRMSSMSFEFIDLTYSLRKIVTEKLAASTNGHIQLNAKTDNIPPF